MKIIPAIDLMDGKVVRLYRGNPENKTVYSLDPSDTAKRWQQNGADMLHVVDLDAAFGRGDNASEIKKIAESVSVPVEVAGGLRDRERIIAVSEFADRMVIGTMAFNDRNTLDDVSKEVGIDRVVISVDHREGTIVANGWQKSTGVQLLDGIKGFQESGFSEFLLTSVNRDGTMEGPDLEYLRHVCESYDVNVIASGGISSVDDVLKVRECNPFGVILGKALYEGKISIEEAKKAVS